MQINILDIVQRAKGPDFTVGAHAYDRCCVAQDILDGLDLIESAAPQDLVAG